MKYKAGDEVLIKAEVTDVAMGGARPYFVAPDKYSVNWVSEDKIIPMDKTYAQGLADAWELAKKILEMKIDVAVEVFDCTRLFDVMDKFGPQEALAKVEAYEKGEIKVGDVVVQKDTQKKFLVVTEEDDNSVYEFGVIDLEILMLDRICNDTKIFQKTGKHIDIESLLKEIGE